MKPGTWRAVLRDGVNQRHQAEQAQGLRSRLNEREQRLREQQDAERQLAEFCKRQGKRYDIDDLETLHQELEARIASLADSVSNAQEQRAWRCVRSWSNCSRGNPDADASGAGLAGGAEQP
ncbi:hypothetical protein LNQ03_06125 [Klebsiella pneumoniae subsp. pneumoniae]|nr:hypothetical protein [Klebsiella pneumoniae subsp. pneumoniae]